MNILLIGSCMSLKSSNFCRVKFNKFSGGRRHKIHLFSVFKKYFFTSIDLDNKAFHTEWIRVVKNYSMGSNKPYIEDAKYSSSESNLNTRIPPKLVSHQNRPLVRGDLIEPTSEAPCCVVCRSRTT